MVFPAVFDPATRPCAKGPQPGTVALEHGVMELYPGMGSLGIFNCRDVEVAGEEPGPPSVHGNGRAWDAKPGTRLQGDLLAVELVRHHLELGVQAVIWWRQAWSLEHPTWHPYAGVDPHTGHAHIEQNIAGAAGLTLEAVRAALAPKTQPLPKDDEMGSTIIRRNATAGAEPQRLLLLDGKMYLGHGDRIHPAAGQEVVVNDDLWADIIRAHGGDHAILT